MSWVKRFTFRDKRGISHKVGGVDFMFYPNHMALLTEAKDMAEPVAKAINALFADQSRDSGSAVKRTSEGDFYVEDTVTEPLSIEMAKHRVKERADAIATIMGTLACPKSLMLLGKLFMDSLRDEFKYEADRAPEDVDAFLYGDKDPESGYDGLDLPVLVELFKGWMKANAVTFGDTGESLVGLVKGKIEAIVESNSAMQDPTNGEPSKTPSLPQSDSDSTPPISTD